MSQLLFSNSLASLSSLSLLSSSSFLSSYPSLKLVVTATPASRLQFKSIDVHLESFNRVRLHNATLRSKTVIMNASSDIDGTSSTGNSEVPAESKEGVVPVDQLPLESKLQERAEQKLRMKPAKKIRLRRKRLVRKRRLREKGRWPPSKMNKLKNV